MDARKQLKKKEEDEEEEEEDNNIKKGCIYTISEWKEET